MRKIISKIAGLMLGLSLAAGVGVAISNSSKTVKTHAANVSDTIDGTNCSSWKSASTSWHDETYTGSGSGLVYNAHFMGGGSNSDGRTFAWNANGYLYVSGTATRELVSVTITTSANTKSIGIYASNTAYSGSPSGSALSTLSATTSGATYTFTGSYKYLALKGTASSTFIKSIVVTYGEESTTPELALDKSSISVSKGEDSTFVVSATNLTANFSVTGGDSSYFTTSYTASSANGNHVVTLHGVSITSAPITLTVSSTGATSQTISVSVVEAVYYEKVIAASDIKLGRELIIGSADGTQLLGKYVSGNNCPAIENVPNASGKLIQTNLPDDFALLTVGGSSGAWTLTDQDSRLYYGTSGQNYLKAGSSDTWSISITAAGVATITSAASTRSIKYNSSNGIFGAYASGQNDISIYMIPSEDPAIQVTVSGSTSLGIGESATLTANLLNGASGTVNWTTSNSSVLSLSTTTGDSVVITAGSTTGSASITASLSGCDDVVTSFTVRKGSATAPYTVAEARTVIDGSDAAAKTGIYVSGVVSQVDTLNSDNSITYWISDNGTTTNQMEVYKGFGLSSATFSSIDELQLGDQVVVYGDIKKYSPSSGDPIYEFNSGNYLYSFNRPVIELATITAIEGTLTAKAGDESWDLSGLTVKGTYTGDATVVDVTALVDLSTSDVPGSPASTTTRNVSITATGKDDSSITYTQNVSGTINVASGLIASGQYRIHATRDSVTYYLKENGTSGAPTAVTNFWEATIFTFTLVDDNTYVISSGDNFLYSTATNNGVRFGDTTTATDERWTITAGEGTLTGDYNLYSSSGSRYLSLYNAADWRGYTTADASNRKENTDLQAFNADQFASEFVSTYTAGCNADGGYTAESMKWDVADAQFDELVSSEQSKLLNATYTISGSGSGTIVTATGDTSQSVAEAIARYDYIVAKYGSETFTNFIDRSITPLSGAPYVIPTINNNNSSTIIIVVVALTSISSIGVLLVIKRKRSLVK